MVGACGWDQHTDKQSVSECKPRSVGHALLVMPVHWTHSMQESSQAATDNYHNECGVLETHTHKRLLQKYPTNKFKGAFSLKTPLVEHQALICGAHKHPPPHRRRPSLFGFFHRQNNEKPRVGVEQCMLKCPKIGYLLEC